MSRLIAMQAETVIVQEQHWTAAARHADIILPATTTLERNDIARRRYQAWFSAKVVACQPW